MVWTLMLFLLFLATTLRSQIKYTAVLPDVDVAIVKSDQNLKVSANDSGQETAKSFFKFNLNHLPIHAKVSLLDLKMYNLPNPNMSDFSTQLITILKGPNSWTGKETSLSAPSLSWTNIANNKPIGRDELRKKTTVLSMKLRIPESPKYVKDFIPDGTLSLAARSPAKGQSNRFYSSITAETPGNFSKKPKLVVRYEVDPNPFRSDWAQPLATAQHTSALSWKKNTTTASAMVRKLPNPNNDLYDGIDPTGAVAIYQNLPIVFAHAVSGTNNVFYVKQLDSKGNVLWSKGVDNVAKCWPMIDEQGHMYYISKSNKLSILDLNNAGNIVFSETIATITKNQLTQVDWNATLGYDGTLYLTGEKGIVALSAYPQLKMRWKYEAKTNERNGPISLSPDERTAFFINVNTQQRKSRLIVLDNMNGSPQAISDYVLGGYRDANNNYYIPSPVVKDFSRVFVLNGYDNSNALYVFDYESGKLTDPQIISSSQSNNTGISQPVIDNASNVFFVYNNKLARYDASKPNKVDVFAGSTSLNNGSVLVTNASSNIFALDSYSTPKKVVGFNYNGNFKNTFTANIDVNTRNNFALAPDGTLYTATGNNLIAITPKKVAVDNLTISQSDLRTNTAYQATSTITVEGFSVLPSINTVLFSDGSISFKPGFSVTKGAEVTCKTGY